jgi:hypothetical membrane protein
MRIEEVDKKKLAGILLFLVGVIAFMGIITSESFYPENIGYSIRENEISDLGATKPPDSVVTQPSATIFNTTMLVVGILTFVATILIHLHYDQILVTILLGLLSIGMMGAGVFSQNITSFHSIFAFIIFSSGGIGAIYVSYKLVNSPLKYVFMVLGVIGLIFLMFDQQFSTIFGPGGSERWIFYPVVFWIMGLGSYLSAKK